MGGVHGGWGAYMGGVCAWQGACMVVGGMCGGWHVWQGGMCGGWGACVVVGGVGSGGMHGGQACMAGGVCDRGHAHAPTHYEIRSVNARAVRILLECILVCNYSN